MTSPLAPEDRKDPKKRVVVIGIDGATFNILGPMAESGRLPNLANLIEEGSSGVLESTLPPVTIPAWVSMLTGMNPGQLGLFDLLKRKGYGVEPNSYCFESFTPLWRILNKYGFRTGIMNIPGTYPPDEVDGFMVTGMMTPSKKSPFSYPDTLGSDLDNKVSEYEIDVPQWQYSDSTEFVEDLYKMTEKRGLAAEYLIGQIPCDFYMIVFTSTDRLQHVLWKDRDIVEAFWEELDRIIGNILDLFDEETTVFIVSDHGFDSLKKTFYVNEWLNLRGFLRVKRRIDDGFLIKLGRLVERTYRYLGETKLIRPISKWLSSILGFERLSKYTYTYLSNERLEGRVNWRRTKAFSCVHSPHFGHIYLNIKGRMGKGCVPEEEKEDLRESILKELKSPQTIDGDERVIIEAYRSEDIYSGQHISEAPDIVFLLDGGRYEVDAKVGEGKIFVDGAPMTGWTGTHTRDGVFIAKGPDIKKGFRIEKSSIIDVVPTLLNLYGISQLDNMDGRVLDEIFREDVAFEKREKLEINEEEPSDKGDLSDEEKALIEARLRKLGYIS
jgi:predicted AlkP superfamily phosphohydrolase/phosphomutase